MQCCVSQIYACSIYTHLSFPKPWSKSPIGYRRHSSRLMIISKPSYLSFVVLTCATALHHLVITLHVRSNENNLSPKAVPDFLEYLDSVWSSTTLLRVPKYHSFGLNVFVDQTSYC